MDDTPIYSDRPRGLTNEDRKFLVEGDDSLKPGTRRQRWSRIRDRTTSIIYDLALLNNHLSDEECRRIFSPEYQERHGGWEVLENAMQNGLALFIHALYLNDETHREHGTDADALVNELIKGGLSLALWERGYLLPASTFTLDIEPVSADVDKLREDFKEGERLSFEEFEMLQQQVSTTDFTEDAYVVHDSSVEDDSASERPE
jgi:hypothetical protein